MALCTMSGLKLFVFTLDIILVVPQIGVLIQEVSYVLNEHRLDSMSLSLFWTVLLAWDTVFYCVYVWISFSKRYKFRWIRAISRVVLGGGFQLIYLVLVWDLRRWGLFVAWPIVGVFTSVLWYWIKKEDDEVDKEDTIIRNVRDVRDVGAVDSAQFDYYRHGEKHAVGYNNKNNGDGDGGDLRDGDERDMSQGLCAPQVRGRINEEGEY